MASEKMVSKTSDKQKMMALILCIVPAIIGLNGIHRFYVGKIGSGVAQFLTCGGLGIWTLIDLIMIATDSFTDAEGRKLS